MTGRGRWTSNLGVPLVPLKESSDLIKRGHVSHIFFPPTATVAPSTPTDGSLGFSPVSPEEKVILTSSQILALLTQLLVPMCSKVFHPGLKPYRGR